MFHAARISGVGFAKDASQEFLPGLTRLPIRGATRLPEIAPTLQVIKVIDANASARIASPLRRFTKSKYTSLKDDSGLLLRS
jgi:hypothetical protein